MEKELNDFYPLMKVCLNSEYGVVMDEFWEGDGCYMVNGITYQGVPYKLYGLIRWDTNKKEDFEDWRGLWGSFIAMGGRKINENYQFEFINDDGTLKSNSNN
jgi:hypothetical protein